MVHSYRQNRAQRHFLSLATDSREQTHVKIKWWELPDVNNTHRVRVSAGHFKDTIGPLEDGQQFQPGDAYQNYDSG